MKKHFCCKKKRKNISDGLVSAPILEAFHDLSGALSCQEVKNCGSAPTEVCCSEGPDEQYCIIEFIITSLNHLGFFPETCAVMSPACNHLTGVYFILSGWRMFTQRRTVSSPPTNSSREAADTKACMALVWHRIGLYLVLVWHRIGQYLALVWHRIGPYLVLVWHRIGPYLALVWLSLSHTHTHTLTHATILFPTHTHSQPFQAFPPNIQNGSCSLVTLRLEHWVREHWVSSVEEHGRNRLWCDTYYTHAFKI